MQICSSRILTCNFLFCVWYICLVLLGGDLDHIDNDEERMLICQEQNEKAIDMLERILID